MKLFPVTLLGKTFTVDPITKQRLDNMGEEEQYYIKDHNEPIISKDCRVNSLFKENYDINLTEVSIGNNQFINNDFDIIAGDLFIKMIEENKKPYHYHLGFQTRND